MKLKYAASMVIMFVLVTAFSVSYFAKPAIGDNPSLFIAEVKNDVKVKKGDSGKWQDAKPKMALAMNDSVKTGKASYATLKFSYPEDNCFKLDQSTEIMVGELVKGNDVPLKKVNMKMLKGGTWAKLKGVKSKDFDFTLTTPNTVAAISGTALATIVYDKEDTYFCACDGMIQIGHPGKSVTIKRCQGTMVKGGVAPSAPASDKFIITDKKYEKDPRYGWCIHCHSMMKKKSEAKS